MSEILETDFRQVLLPIIATTKYGEVQPVGTGFIFYIHGRHALMFSAAHIFQRIEKLDRPYELSDSTTLQEFRLPPPEHNVLTCTDMHVLFRSNDSAEYIALLPHVYPWRNDTAVCIIELGDQVPEDVHFVSSVIIDTTPAVKGEEILAVGYTNTQIVESSSKEGRESLSFQRGLTWRRGHIIDVFPTGRDSMHPWPCFQTDVAFDSSMSGGPILKKAGDLLVACGVISSDLTAGNSDLGVGSGQAAIASMLWPTMAVSIDEALVEGTRGPMTLLELQRRNFIRDLGNASAHVEILPESRMRYRRLIP